MLPLDANQTTLVLDARVFYRFRNNHKSIAGQARSHAHPLRDGVGAGLPRDRTFRPTVTCQSTP